MFIIDRQTFNHDNKTNNTDVLYNLHSSNTDYIICGSNKNKHIVWPFTLPGKNDYQSHYHSTQIFYKIVYRIDN